MRYFKIAYNLIVSRFVFTLIIIVEVAALLILSNTIKGVYNGKNMLYKPYKDIFENNAGVAMDVDDLLWRKETQNSDVEKLREESGYIDVSKVIKLIENKLEGDVRVYSNAKLNFFEPIGPKTEVGRIGGADSIDYYLVDDEIFSKLRLPLAQGRWASSEKTSNGEIEIVVSGGTDAKLGNVYDTPAGKLKVVGILTDNTYIPPGQGYEEEHEGGLPPVERNIFGYYLPFDTEVSMIPSFCIADKKLFENAPDKYNWIEGGDWFVSYGSGLTDKQIKSNTEYLSTIGYVEDKWDFSTIVDESNKKLNDIYLRMLPIMITAVVVVLAGLIGSVAMSTIRQMKTFGIFFICGCRWRDCIKIISANIIIVFGIAVILAIAGGFAMSTMNLEYLIGFSLDWNNLIFSIGILGVMYLMSVILPHNIIKSSSPVETIKEN